MHVTAVHNGNLPAHPGTIPMIDGTFRPQLELPKWMCMYCAKDFVTLEEMQHHVNSEHSSLVNGDMMTSPSKSSTNPNSPDKTSNSSLHDHQNNSPTYACDSCTMQFDSVEKLRVHENCIHWKPPQGLAPHAGGAGALIKDCNSCIPSGLNLNDQVSNTWFLYGLEN